jgi:amino acid adenylation domain-containing protein
MNDGNAANPDADHEPAEGRNLVSRFEKISAACAGRVAIIEASTDAGRSDAAYSYSALDKRRLEIATALIDKHGVGPGDRVGLVQARRFDTIAAMLGIATVGANYVPLDPELPVDRRRFVLEDADVRVILSAESGPAVGDFPGSLPLEELHGEPRAHSSPGGPTPLYVMYTSGSTGTPKGVVVPHRAVYRLVVATDFMVLDRQTRFLHLAPQSFDAATLEIWGPLLNGGTCVLYPDGVFDPGNLEAVVSKHRVSALWLTATLFNQVVVQRPVALGQLNTLLFGGERASVPHVRQASRLWPGTTLINGYGPTENTTFTCCHRVRARDVDEQSQEIPIGKPITGTIVRIVDHDLVDVAAGATGELLAGGDGLADGYLNRAELTAERFFFDANGKRWYRTGDLVSQDKEGVVHFRGRADRQLKIHGHRIEPGEVEATLLADERIKNAHVLAVKTPAKDQKLVAYLVGEFDRATLQQRLAQALPRFMVPSVFVGIDELPTTANGKVDVAALPNPFAGNESVPAAATGEGMARLVAATWQNVVPGIALESDDDNFFDVGGTSMDMILVRDALERQLATSISLVTLFQYPTVSKLATHLDNLDGGHAPAGSARERAAQRREQLARRRAGRAPKQR